MIVVPGWLAFVAATASTTISVQTIHNILIIVCLAHGFAGSWSKAIFVSAAAAVSSSIRASVRATVGIGSGIGAVQLHIPHQVHITINVIWMADVTTMTLLLRR